MENILHRGIFKYYFTIFPSNLRFARSSKHFSSHPIPEYTPAYDKVSTLSFLASPAFIFKEKADTAFHQCSRYPTIGSISFHIKTGSVYFYLWLMCSRNHKNASPYPSSHQNKPHQSIPPHAFAHKAGRITQWRLRIQINNSVIGQYNRSSHSRICLYFNHLSHLLLLILILIHPQNSNQ
mgnify:CR=1 FL=1